MTHDQRTYYLRVLYAANREKGLGFAAAMGEALRAVDGGGFDWTQHFKPTVEDMRLLSVEGIQ